MRKTQANIALIFDMDGTLIDSNPTHKEAYRRFLHDHDIEMTDEDFLKYISGRMNPDIMKHFFGEDISRQKITALARKKETLFQEMFKDKIKPIRGLLSFLKQVKERNLPTALATSAPMMNIKFVFEHIPVGEYFDKIVYDRDVTVGKPEPDVFQIAARKLRVNPDHCVVFEDSMAGIEAALKAGMKVVALTTTHSSDELKDADLVIADFNEVTVPKVEKLF